MLRLIDDEFSFNKLVRSPVQGHHDEVVERYAVGKAETRQMKMELDEEFEIVSTRVSDKMYWLFSQVDNLLARLSAKGLSTFTDKTVLDRIVETRRKNFKKFLWNLYEGSNRDQRLFLAHCGGEDIERFGIDFRIGSYDYPHEDRAKFWVRPRFFHDLEPMVEKLHSNEYFKVKVDGTIEGLDLERICQEIIEFFMDPENYQAKRSRL